MIPGLNPRQVRDLVVRPALAALNLPGGLVAEKFIMGIGAQESQFAAIHQVGGGPALSLWQIEPSTAQDALDRASHPIRLALETLRIGPMPIIGQLPGNLYLGAGMCRVVVYLKDFKMPTTWDLPTMADLYKRFYNSAGGAATPAEFVGNYQRYVAPLYP